MSLRAVRGGVVVPVRQGRQPTVTASVKPTASPNNNRDAPTPARVVAGAPLLEALVARAATPATALHVPGHKVCPACASQNPNRRQVLAPRSHRSCTA
jgi:hypothetical protein